MEHTKVKEIILEVYGGSRLQEATHEAIITSIKHQANVRFEFNGTDRVIKYGDLMLAPKEIKQ